MKTPKSVGQAYDFISAGHLIALGEYPDITAAFYDGDYSKTLRGAQRGKHNWVLEGIKFEEGDRVLDIGSGWGPMLKVIKDRKGCGRGLTVSKKQTEYCRRRGLDVLLQDWKEANPGELGSYDGAISIGAFEHFCSKEEYFNGQQERIYGDFFRFCHGILRDNGRLYLQTMLWGSNAPDFDKVKNDSTSGTPERIMRVLLDLSSWWPPASKKQILKAAEPYFEFIESNNGRKDYVQTFEEWYKGWGRALKTKRVKTSFVLLRLTNRDFRNIYSILNEQLQGNYFQRAFAESLLDHERMFFEKRPV